MKTAGWNPNAFHCWFHRAMPGKDHAKGCRHDLTCMRRHPGQPGWYFSVECSKLLPEETQRKLVRCIPTEGLRTPDTR